MYGSFLSVLLMGVVPVWGMHGQTSRISQEIRVSPPAVIASDDLQSLHSQLTASGVIIVDLDSGQTVYERNIAMPRPMASLTKLMTALIIVEHHDLNEVVTVPRNIADVQGTVAHLPPNEQFTVGSLLSALLIMSANDAAVALAEFHAGSMEGFVKQMNERAQQLGLKETSYGNATGLDEPTQKSSPRNLSWLAMYVMKNPSIAERMSIPAMKIATLSGKTLTLIHTHQLLRDEDKGILAGNPDGAFVLAGKTGTTDAAGQCLLSIVEAKDRRYIIVLLHSHDRYADMRRVLEILTN